jgi:hypothetical protein
MSEFSPVDFKARLQGFWSWFSIESPNLADLVERCNTRALADLLQANIDSLACGFGWEIGPLDNEGFYLALTLNGERKLIKLAELVVDSAPLIKGWKFLVGKPARESDNEFSLINEHGDKVNLDISDWTYILTAYDNNSFFDINFLVDTLPNLDANAKKQAAFLVADMKLGERFALETIADATITTPVSLELLKNATPVDHLKDHLNSLKGI